MSEGHTDNLHGESSDSFSNADIDGAIVECLTPEGGCMSTTSPTGVNNKRPRKQSSSSEAIRNLHSEPEGGCMSTTSPTGVNSERPRKQSSPSEKNFWICANTHKNNCMFLIEMIRDDMIGSPSEYGSKAVGSSVKNRLLGLIERNGFEIKPVKIDIDRNTVNMELSKCGTNCSSNHHHLIIRKRNVGWVLSDEHNKFLSFNHFISKLRTYCLPDTYIEYRDDPGRSETVFTILLIFVNRFDVFFVLLY